MSDLQPIDQANYLMDVIPMEIFIHILSFLPSQDEYFMETEYMVHHRMAESKYLEHKVATLFPLLPALMNRYADSWNKAYPESPFCLATAWEEILKTRQDKVWKSNDLSILRATAIPSQYMEGRFFSMAAQHGWMECLKLCTRFPIQSDMERCARWTGVLFGLMPMSDWEVTTETMVWWIKTWIIPHVPKVRHPILLSRLEKIQDPTIQAWIDPM